MTKITINNFNTSFGELVLGSFNDQLVLCDWRYRKMRNIVDERIKKELGAEFETGNSIVLEKTKNQLEEYFSGQRKHFEIPLLLAGTDFQKSVWAELLKIPFGKTETYFDLSKKINNIKAIRAVASANGANAIAIIVPCHRIIGSNGELTGYAGGLNSKRKLLQLEAQHFEQKQFLLFDSFNF